MEILFPIVDIYDLFIPEHMYNNNILLFADKKR